MDARAKYGNLPTRVLRPRVLFAVLFASPPAAAIEFRPPASGPKAEVLGRVARAAQCVLGLAAFRTELEARARFAESHDDGKAVLDLFERPVVCRIGTYRRGGWIGYFFDREPVDARHIEGSNRVEFNLNRFRDDDLPFLVGTVMHECAHRLGYRHRHNDRFAHPEIEETVPYQVGFLAETHAPACLDGQPRP